jgi:cytochrome c5
MSIRKALVFAAVASVMVTWANAQTTAPKPAPDPASPPAAAPPPAMPARGGQEILEGSCTGCHDLGVLTATPHTAEDWPVVLKRMEGNGLNISPADLATVQAYLTEHYSAGPDAH